MAFVSEIHYRDDVATSSGVPHYVEVAVSPDDLGRLPQFELIAYAADGSIAQTFSLSDYAGVVDPVTGWTIFQLPVRLVADPAPGQIGGIAFVDFGQDQVLKSFYALEGSNMPATATEGPAAGYFPIPLFSGSGETIQFDAYGNQSDGPMTQGAAPICLTQGTLIETPDGARPIETLHVGDLVTTWDNGDQPIRMIHSRRISGAEYAGDRRLWPIRISSGALGFGLPERDLWVSPQHKMLYCHIRIPLMFGEDAVFVQAKSLAASFDRVHVDSSRTSVTYFHLVFDRHEVIFAEGAATESLHPGPEAIAGLIADAREELYSIFPQLRMGEARDPADFLTLRSWELRTAVA